eukprot:3989797-Alexandrium_andersonii.AAC.1
MDTRRASFDWSAGNSAATRHPRGLGGAPGTSRFVAQLVPQAFLCLVDHRLYDAGQRSIGLLKTPGDLDLGQTPPGPAS